MMHCWAKRRHPRDWHLLSALGLDPLSSHSPSAPLILSKSHYNPTNPTASHRGCLFSGSPALHIRIWSWAGGSSPPPPLPSMRKLILSCHCALSSSLLVNALVARPPGSRELVLGEVGGNSVADRTGRGCFHWPVGASFSFCPCVLLQENTQSEEKITNGFL